MIKVVDPTCKPSLQVAPKQYHLSVCRIRSDIRCVYVNDYRIVGAKPYVSENFQTHNFNFTLTDLQKAFPDLNISEK